MRELHHLVTDIDRQLGDAVLAKQQLDAERWREQIRPRAMRVFAARAAKLHCSRALLKLLVEELYPDLDGTVVRLKDERKTELSVARDRVRHLKERLGI